jgi:hypothetical protein
MRRVSVMMASRKGAVEREGQLGDELGGRAGRTSARSWDWRWGCSAR